LVLIFLYILKFTNVTNQDTFEYNHAIYQGSFLADKKSGTGKYKRLNDGELEIKYQDPETEFEGVLFMDDEVIKGKTHQVKGFSRGDRGSFNLKLSNE